MSQTDLDVANGTGAVVRADINTHLDALVTLSSGAAAPTTTFPNQYWYDTTAAVLKRRDNANTVWQHHLDGKEATAVASAATTNIWADDGDTIHVTGVLAITSFGTAPQVGAWRKVIFDGSLLLTDGANLNLPGGTNIQTKADDFALVYAETTTLFKVLYFKVAGPGADINVQTGTTYTLKATDNGRTITLDNAAAITLTLPQTSTEAIDVDFQCAIIQKGAGQVTVAIEGTDTVLSKSSNLKLAAQGVAATIIKTTDGSPNAWALFGDLVA